MFSTEEKSFDLDSCMMEKNVGSVGMTASVTFHWSPFFRYFISINPKVKFMYMQFYSGLQTI